MWKEKNASHTQSRLTSAYKYVSLMSNPVSLHLILDMFGSAWEKPVLSLFSPVKFQVVM